MYMFLLMRFNEKSSVHVALIVFLGILVYSNTFQVPFHFDDKAFIVNNPLLKDFRYFVDSSMVHEAIVSEDIKVYFRTRPVGALSLWANYRLGGLDVWGYHAVNIALHLANALLVYLLVLLTFSTPLLSESFLKDRRRLIALFSGLLFVAHPVETEAVTYITQRQVLLAATFYLLSLFLYVNWRLGTTVPSSGFGIRRRGLLYFLSILSCVLAMKSKETAFTLPIAIALYEFLFFRNGLTRRALYLVPFLATLFVIPLTYLSIYMDTGVWSTLREITSIAPDTAHPEYMYTQFTVTIENIRLLFLPMGQHVDHYTPAYHSFFDPPVFLSFFFLLCTLGLSVYLYYYSRVADSALLIVSSGIFWYFLTFAVESSFLPINEIMVEYRIYLPSVGILVSAVVLFFHQFRASNKAAIAFLGVILLLAGAAYSRNAVWQNEISLWEDSVGKSPMKARAHYNLGKAYERNDMPDLAIEHFDTAISLDPGHMNAYVSMGNALLSKGQVDDAMRRYMKALMLDPKDSGTRTHLGNAFRAKGQIDQAIIQYRIAAELNPNDRNANFNLGVIYFASGMLDEARFHLESIASMEPDNTGVHYKLGMIHDAKDNPDSAIGHFRNAIKIDPGFARAHYGLGLAYHKKGLLAEARRELEATLRLDSGHGEARLLLDEILNKTE
jgi:tetratricopeptide (TPR) repeat protein